VVNRLHVFRCALLACIVALVAILGAPLAHGAPKKITNAVAPKVVTVGYYYDKNFQEGVSDSSMKSGYGYEYLQQISDYTGWQYKYIYGDWNKVYNMFLKGEVDIMAGLAYREDRLGLMEYPDYYIDVEHHYIFTSRKDTTMSGERLSSLNGKRIGCLANSNLQASLRVWAEEKGIQLEFVEYDNMSDLPAALERGDVDGFVGSKKNIDQSMNVKPLVLYNSPKSYVCVRKGANRLLRELNAALANIDANDAQTMQYLKDKYYREDAYGGDFSARELEWLNGHRMINVAYASDYLPFCAKDKDGRVTGVLKDIMNSWLKKVGLEGKLMVEYTEFTRYAKAAEALARGEVDAVFPQPNNRWYAEQIGLMVSKELVDVPMSIVYKDDFNAATLSRIAVTSRPIQNLFVRNNFPESQRIKVKDGTQCLRAVLDGRATSSIMTTFRVAPLMSEGQYSQLKVLPIGEGMAYAMGVRKGDFGLLSLLNRGFGQLDYSAINNSMYGYMGTYKQYTVRDFIRDHVVVVVVVLSLLGLIIIACLILYISGVKKAQHETQVQVEVTEALSLDYPYAILVDIEKGFSITIKKDGKVLKEKDRIYHESYDTAWKYFANRHVLDEDRDEVLKASTLDVVLENLKHRQEYICTYRAEWDDKVHYAQSSYTRIYSSTLKKDVIILGCKTVDDVVAKERSRQELMANALAVAEHSNQSKTIFLNNMSHDIRTPMNAIIGFTNLAKSHLNDMEAVKGYLGKISISSNHLLSLINNVLDMSRIESGKMKLTEERVHLPSLVREIQDMVQNSAQSKGVGISFYDALSNEVVLADNLKLKQVLINIVGNAIKFTKPGGKVVLSVAERDGAPEGCSNYQFTVADTGIGMSSEFREHVFEAFSRERTSTVSGIQGTGLGMAISKNIIDMMGGTIVVDSTPNIGTKITVSLTLKFGDGTRSSPAISEVDPTDDLFKSNTFDFSGKRVLLVEDNPLNQEIATSILEELGFVVELAEDGMVAVEKVRQNPAGLYNVILMDVQMPYMDGYEATRQIRNMADSAKSLIPILAVTANAFEEDRQKAFECGMNGHIAKPISISELMEKLGKLV